MSKKYAAEYRKQKRAEWAQRLQAERDKPLLDLLEKLRPYTHGAELHDDPRSLAMRRLHSAIDDVAEAVTGDREYFFSRPSSMG